MTARPKALNPQAHQFQPSNVQGGAVGMTNAVSNQQQLSPINDADDDDNLHAQFITLRDAMIEELCLLRRDLNLIMNGGWQLTIGPWQVMQPSMQPATNDHDVKDIRDRISKALDGDGVVSLDETTKNRPQLITDGRSLTSPDASDVKAVTTSDSKSPQTSHLLLTINGLQSEKASTKLTLPSNDLPNAANPLALRAGSVTGIKERRAPQETLHQVVKAYAAGPVQNSIKQDVQTLGVQRAQAAAQGEVEQIAPATVNDLAAPIGTTTATNLVRSISPRLIVQATGDIDKRDLPKPSVEDCAIPISTTNWMPRGIRDLKPLAIVSSIPTLAQQVSFTWDFLSDLLRGLEHSPGLYYSPKSTGMAVLRGRTYYIIDRTYEPYMPKAPGHHGAKLTAFFNNSPTADGDDISYENLPLFITSNGKDFYYFGQYSQKRWSDKLDYDRMSECVPDAVKMHHAELLADPARPKWVTDQLVKHFWPKPEYFGAVVKIPHEAVGSTQPTQVNGNVNGDGVGALGAVEKEEKKVKKARREMDEYMMDLRAWEKEAKLKVGLIKKETILEAFEEADAADPPGLRLWWEYLQCVGFDQAFYKTIAQLQLKARSEAPATPARQGRVEALMD